MARLNEPDRSRRSRAEEASDDDVTLIGVARPPASRPSASQAPGEIGSTHEHVSEIKVATTRPGWLFPVAAIAAFAILVAAISSGSTQPEAVDEASSDSALDDAATGNGTDDDGTENGNGDGSTEAAPSDEPPVDTLDPAWRTIDGGSFGDEEAGAAGAAAAEAAPTSFDAIDVEITDAVGEWRTIVPPPGTEILLLQSDAVVAASVPGPNSAGSRRQLWSLIDGRVWNESGVTPEGVSEVFATGPLLWGRTERGDLHISSDRGGTWTLVPDDGQAESSPLLSRNRAITAAAIDPSSGSVVFRATASWFFDVLAYRADLGEDDDTQCTARVADGVLIFDNLDCSGVPIQQITYDELDLTTRERGILRNPQRSAAAAIWLIDADGGLRSLRDLDDSLDGRPVLRLSIFDDVVTALEESGMEHRVANANTTLEMTETGFDGPIGRVGGVQIGRESVDEQSFAVVREPSDRLNGWTRWADTGLRADVIAVNQNVAIVGSNPGFGASPPITLEVGDGFFLSHNQTPSGDVFDLVVAESGTVLTANAGAISWLERVGDDGWAVEIEGTVVGEFSDDDWLAAAEAAGYNAYGGLATSLGEPSLVSVTRSGTSWVRTATTEILRRPAFVEAVLAAPTSALVAVTDASLDLETLSSARPPRFERVEWFVLDLS